MGNQVLNNGQQSVSFNYKLFKIIKKIIEIRKTFLCRQIIKYAQTTKIIKGKLLRNDLEKMTADSSLMDQRCILKFHQSKVLPLSEWNYLRPIQSKFDFTPLFKHIFDSDHKFFMYSNYQGSKIKTKFKTDTEAEAQKIISKILIYHIYKS